MTTGNAGDREARHPSSATVLGTCHHDCPDSCGWEVTVENGRAVRLRGNPAHPFSRGELCPKVNRFLERVYSPDRLLTPLLRTGPKGSGQFRRATWDEALETVAQRLHSIIDTWGGEAIVPWGDAGTQSLAMVAGLNERFFARLGASTQSDYICGGTSYFATAASLGSSLACDPSDVRHARFIVLWGTNTRLTNRHLWPFIEEARAGGATVVVIDPVRTVTADAADWFIQPLPGTDVAFALGVMHVLVRDELIDHQFVEQHTTGFDELRTHVADWPPDRASAECGVPATEIERFASAYASSTPAMIRTMIGPEHRRNGAQFYRTIMILPTLIGAWRHRGGGLARGLDAYARSAVDMESFAAPHLAGDRQRRPVSMTRLGRALLDDQLAPPIKALFVFNGNPLVALPEAGLLRAGLQRDDLFTVVSEQFLTDTARFADVVFPATTQIEHTDVVAPYGHLYLGWNERAIEPVGECVPNTELWRRLARAMGFTDPELYATDEELLEGCLAGVDIATLRRDGFLRMSVAEDLRPFADGFPTPDGRMALANADLEAVGLGRLPMHVAGGEGRVDSDPRYPLSLMTPKTHHRFLGASYSHMRSHAEPEGGPFCELHPADAEARGVADGDAVEVVNERGRLRMRARVSATPRTQRGMVLVPFGWLAEHSSDRRTVNELTSDTAADFGGGVAFYDTSVDVVRAD